MKPFMPAEETAMYMKYLSSKQTLLYYEFGSGGSTYVACEAAHIHRIWSTETDKVFYEKVCAEPVVSTAITNKKLTYMLTAVGGRNNWGYPVDGTPKEDWVQYFQHINTITEIPDVVLIDGRFRVACALHTYMAVDAHTFVLFDDFMNRSFYHDVLKYFTIVETAERLVVLKKKMGLTVDPVELERYESDPR